MVSILDKTVLKYLADAHLFNIAAIEHQKLAQKATDKAKKMVEAGESTGDPLRDYVIVATGKDSEDLTELLHATEAVLADNVGELILFVYSWEKEGLMKDMTGTEHDTPGKDSATMNTLYLGIISGAKLIVSPQEGFCDFPIERLLEKRDGLFYFGNQISPVHAVIPGNAVIRNILLKEDQDFLQRIWPVTPFESWEFKIGSADIIDWMRKNHRWEKALMKMSSELGVTL